MFRSEDNEYERIVLRATTIQERLSQLRRYPFLSSKYPDAISDQTSERLKRWAFYSTNSDDQKFQGYLRIVGVNSARDINLVLSDEAPGLSELPQWAVFGRTILRWAEEIGSAGDLDSLTKFELPPRADTVAAAVLTPLVTRIITLVRSAPGRLPHATRESCTAAFSKHVLQKLQALLGASIDIEFAAYVEAASQIRRSNGVVSDLFGFKSYWWAMRFRQYVETNPVALRVLSTLIHQYLAFYWSFEESLSDDWTFLRSWVSGKSAVANILSVEFGLSDDHHGGRSAVSLEFDNGVGIIFKPRSGKPEQLFDQVMTEILGRPCQLQVLDRSTYSWVRRIRDRVLDGVPEILEYCENAGALLFLAFATNTGDLHEENIVVGPHGPICIDCEGFLSPRTGKRAHSPDEDCSRYFHPRSSAAQFLEASVLATGLLPSLAETHSDAFMDHGGIAGPLLRQGAVCLASKFRQRKNADSCKFSPAPEWNILPGLVIQSFEASLLQCNSLWRDSMGQLLQRVSTSAVLRYIHAPTELYERLMAEACEPRNLRSGIDWSVCFESVIRNSFGAFNFRKEPQQSDLALALAEIEQMTLLDIPYFSHKPSSRSLILHDGSCISEFFATAGLDAAMEKNSKLQECSIKKQTQLIGDCFATPSYREVNGMVRRETIPIDNGEQDYIERVRTACGHIAEKISERAFTSSGYSSLVGMDSSDASNLNQFCILGPDLYSGMSGVAIYLAAYGDIFKLPQFKDLAHTLTRSSLETIVDPDLFAGLCRGKGVGLSQGVSGIFYAALMIDNDRSPALTISQYNAIASNFRSSCFDKFQFCDLFSDHAAVLLVSSIAYRKTGSDHWQRLGEDILNHAIDCDLQEMIESQSDLSMAHGLAGVALALAHYYRANSSSERVFRMLHRIVDRLVNCLTESASHDSPLTYEDRKLRWCSGITGTAHFTVALCELLGNRNHDMAQQSAKRLFADIRLLPVDSICCGNAGLYDMRLDMGLVGDESALWLTKVVTDHGLHGLIQEFDQIDLGNLPGVGSFGFFTGLSGIGYVLLRSIAPGLRSIILPPFDE